MITFKTLANVPMDNFCLCLLSIKVGCLFRNKMYIISRMVVVNGYGCVEKCISFFRKAGPFFILRTSLIIRYFRLIKIKETLIWILKIKLLTFIIIMWLKPSCPQWSLFLCDKLILINKQKKGWNKKYKGEGRCLEKGETGA